jgi:hypothetical protein
MGNHCALVPTNRNHTPRNCYAVCMELYTRSHDSVVEKRRINQDGLLRLSHGEHLWRP